MNTLKERVQLIRDLVENAQEGIFNNAWINLIVECPECHHEFETEEDIKPADLDMIVDFKPQITAALNELNSLLNEVEIGYHECRKTGEWKLSHTSGGQRETVEGCNKS